MSKVVSMRLKDEEYEWLARLARRERRTPSQMAALLVADRRIEDSFAHIEMRDTVVGREAFIRGRRLKVWQLVQWLRDCDGDPEKAAEALEIPVAWVKAAMNYAEAFPGEIEEALKDNNKPLEELKRLIPDLEVTVLSEITAG